MNEKDFFDYLSSFTNAEQCLSSFSNQKQFFRLNTLKVSLENFKEFSKLSYLPTKYEFAFELSESLEIGKTWEYFLGYIYPQSLPSIIDSIVLNPNKDDVVLDVAASPGSKFSHLAMLMENRSVLVGNEVKKDKISALYSTINRMNILNSIVTIRDGAKLDWKNRFTKVMLDAPCTALGSGGSAIGRWEPDHSKRIAAIQKKMLFSAFDALVPGGELVYSTCTYAKEENEEVVKTLLDNVPSASLLDISVDFPHDRGLSDFGSEFSKCVRFYPQHLQSEGFFIAKIKKGDS